MPAYRMQPARAPRRILVVDDEPSIGRSLSRLLVRAGYAASVAGDGNAAVSLCEQDSFDLVVLDLHMPGQDGMTTLRRLRERRPELPILIMSGDVDVVAESSMGGELARGASAILRKPFDTDALLAEVTRLIGNGEG
jgi:DNA-binding response OmpR family regulator